MPKKGERKYSDEDLAVIASRYNVLSDFRKNESTAYQQICIRGLREKLCGRMKRDFKDYTEEELAAIAKRYNHRNDFFHQEQAAYAAAYRRGIVDKICEHMEWQAKPHGYWTKERCLQIALGYKTRNSFRKGNADAFAAASRNGWVEEICSHMKAIGNWYRRKIYVFTFSDGYAYVGLAQNPDDRYKQHTTYKKRYSPVFDHIQKTGASFEYRILTDWLDKDEVGKVEDKYIKQFEADGWKMLNKVKGGGLGSPKVTIYTEEVLKNAVSKFNVLQDFREQMPTVYKYICKTKQQEKYLSHMKRKMAPRHYWTIENSIAVISECENRGDFRRKYGQAYLTLKTAGLLDKYFPK